MFSRREETGHVGLRSSRRRRFLASPPGLVLIGFLAIGGAYLWMEHRAHLLGALVFLPLLLCPLMHLFMHHGHGEHSEPKGPRQ